jgi:hypothetical protein
MGDRRFLVIAKRILVDVAVFGRSAGRLETMQFNRPDFSPGLFFRLKALLKSAARMAAG